MSDPWLKNLEAIRRRDPALADLLAAAPPRGDLRWHDSQQPGSPGLTIEPPGGSRVTLASRYRPRDDAERFAAAADLHAHAVVLLIGFGPGYAAGELARRCRGAATLVIYEPDPSLLAAVLRKLDHADLLDSPGVILLTGPADPAALTQRLEPITGLITMGLQILTFPPTRQLAADAVADFMQHLTRFVAYCRTTIATTLVQAATTCRNLAANLGHYAAGPTLAGLQNRAAGHPAVLVSAGPSLARNIDQLAAPGVRDRVVIIAVQTVLKPLLEKGVRPHFVTALDYHPISGRFYEGLPPLPDVTLVAEPKAHPSVLDAYPGPVRVLHNRFLDLLLSPRRRPMPALPSGSTVAHLSFYLAQFLGCDPIILVGQDLGFSDGLYYCPGTAIHEVWAPELNAFNTLEMMEWRRIVRHRSHLQRRTDSRGQPIYTDEQMLTYLAQFERDFAAAPQRVLDATEGGLVKQHTTPTTLAAALAEHDAGPLPELVCEGCSDALSLDAVADDLRGRIEEVTELAELSRETAPLLRAMLSDQRDPPAMARHFAALQPMQRRVAQLTEAFNLVSELNQVGNFNRLRADRRIHAAEGDAMEKQSLQLQRDLENVRWLGEACEEALSIFRHALSRLRLRDPRVPEITTQPDPQAGARA